jgi:hypothetical protein
MTKLQQVTKIVIKILKRMKRRRRRRDGGGRGLVGGSYD